MATQHLDLDEQEQLASIKHFWSLYGKWITVVVTIAALSYLSWSFWNHWQYSQSQKSAVLFDELSKSVTAGDIAKTDRVFADMKSQFGATSYTAQAALLNARMNYGAGKLDTAKSALQWLVDSDAETAYRDIARLRLAGLQIEAKQYDAAIQLLSSGISQSFTALAADRLGDAYTLQNKTEEAKGQYLKAYAGLAERDDYRKMIEVKLARMGVTPPAANKATP
jgi:predicted negative regulator of RcsB-dependent stress response